MKKNSVCAENVRPSTLMDALPGSGVSPARREGPQRGRWIEVDVVVEQRALWNLQVGELKDERAASMDGR